MAPSWCAGDLEGIRGLTLTQLVSDVRTLLNPTAVIVVTQQTGTYKDIDGIIKWVAILDQHNQFLMICEYRWSQSRLWVLLLSYKYSHQ